MTDVQASNAPLQPGDVLVGADQSLYVIGNTWYPEYYIQTTGIGGPGRIGEFTPSVVPLPARRIARRDENEQYVPDATVFTELPPVLPVSADPDVALRALKSKI
jgi:hypothetical protein